MTDSRPSRVTQTFPGIASGDPGPAEQLLPIVHSEPRVLTRALIAEVSPGSTLQPTALVHEAYLRLVGESDPGWNSWGQFFSAAARAFLQDELRSRPGGVPIDRTGSNLEPERE